MIHEHTMHSGIVEDICKTVAELG